MKTMSAGKKKWFAAVAAVLCMSMMLCTSAFAESANYGYEGSTVSASNSYNSSTRKASASTTYGIASRGKAVQVYVQFYIGTDVKYLKSSEVGGASSTVTATTVALPPVTTSTKICSWHKVTSGTGGTASTKILGDSAIRTYCLTHNV